MCGDSIASRDAAFSYSDVMASLRSGIGCLTVVFDFFQVPASVVAQFETDIFVLQVDTKVGCGVLESFGVEDDSFLLVVRVDARQSRVQTSSVHQSYLGSVFDEVGLLLFRRGGVAVVFVSYP